MSAEMKELLSTRARVRRDTRECRAAVSGDGVDRERGEDLGMLEDGEEVEEGRACEAL
jgi:hypothetical protein